MSKPANAHPMTSFRTSLWAWLFRTALKAVEKNDLSGDEIDEMIYEELGRRIRDGLRPRIMESLLKGKRLSEKIRKFTTEDCVRAGTRILKNDRLERMYFSPVWQLAIPEKRTLKFTTNAIHRLLTGSRLTRLPIRESLHVVSSIPDRSDGLNDERLRFVARVNRYSEPLLVHWQKQRLISRDDLTILRVLMHQEAHLACNEQLADELYLRAKRGAHGLAQRFFAKVPTRFAPAIRQFKSSMFYCDGAVTESRSELRRATQFVTGLVVPRRVNEYRQEAFVSCRKEIQSVVLPYWDGTSRILGTG